MATESVKYGWAKWEDHSINRFQWTLTEKWATILMAILGVCLSLCWPCILSVILFYFAKFRQAWQGSSRVQTTRGDPQGPHEGTPLLKESNSQPPNPSDSDSAIGGIKKGQAVNGPVPVSPTGTGGHSRRTVRKWLENNTILGIVVLGVFVAWAIGSLFSAGVSNNRAALWDSEYCGVWKFNSSAAGVDAATRHDIYDRQKEARAGEYAQNCYGSADLLKSGRCNLFYEPTIKYTADPRWGCPFPVDKMCVQGIQPMHFYTDLIDPNDIGINSEHLFKFRRNSTCSPLTWEDSYVSNKTAKNGEITYYYEFGNTGHNYNYSYSTTGNPHDWHAPSYVVRTYGTTPWPEQDSWQPIPELKPPQNKTLTIIFISALRIFYPKQNRDPIFPADHPFGSGDEPWYWKSDPKARALACIDSSEICTYDGAKCWPAHDLTHGGISGITLPPEYWYTKLSLENSNIYDSIKTRLGDGLVAQGRVSQYQSQDLGDAFWRIEAERLFQTSLARIQYDAWAIGTGEDQARVRDDGYADDTPDEAGNLCGILKFLSSDYRNVPRTLYICLMSIYPGLLLLSMRVNTVVKVVNWFKEHCYFECSAKRGQKGKGKDPESVLPLRNDSADGIGSAKQGLTKNTSSGLAMQSTLRNAAQNVTTDATGSANGKAGGSAGDGASGGVENAPGAGNGKAGGSAEGSGTGDATDDATADGPKNPANGGPPDAASVRSEASDETASAEADEDELEPPVLHWILCTLIPGSINLFIRCIVGIPWACSAGIEAVRDGFERLQGALARKRINTRV